jgi:ribosomal protein S6
VKLYRLTYLISPKLEKDEAVQVNQKLASFLKEKNGEVKTEKEILQKNLAYFIQKEKTAYLADIVFSLPILELPTLKKFLRTNKNIKRFLLTNSKPLIIKPVRVRAIEAEQDEESVDEKLNRILKS